MARDHADQSTGQWEREFPPHEVPPYRNVRRWRLMVAVCFDWNVVILRRGLS